MAVVLQKYYVSDIFIEFMRRDECFSDLPLEIFEALNVIFNYRIFTTALCSNMMTYLIMLWKLFPGSTYKYNLIIMNDRIEDLFEHIEREYVLYDNHLNTSPSRRTTLKSFVVHSNHYKKGEDYLRARSHKLISGHILRKSSLFFKIPEQFLDEDLLDKLKCEEYDRNYIIVQRYFVKLFQNRMTSVSDYFRGKSEKPLLFPEYNNMEEEKDRYIHNLNSDEFQRFKVMVEQDKQRIDLMLL